MRKKKWVIIIALIGMFSFHSVKASEIKQVETHGTIGFTGRYEPIGTPDPAPEETVLIPPTKEITKPKGLLPQTNDVKYLWLSWLGIILMSYVFYILKRNKKYKIQVMNQKVGISK